MFTLSSEPEASSSPDRFHSRQFTHPECPEIIKMRNSGLHYAVFPIGIRFKTDLDPAFRLNEDAGKAF